MDNESGPIEISNEFTSIRVSKINTGAGARIRIESPRLGYSVDLDPLALESLTWQEPDFFSHLLRTPLGPMDGLEIVPLSRQVNRTLSAENG